jgi:hypothetical protein
MAAKLLALSWPLNEAAARQERNEWIDEAVKVCWPSGLDFLLHLGGSTWGAFTIE